MNKKFFAYSFLILFFLSLISAIQITEVELNPPGTDAGNEWVEFYSSDNIDLSFYKIKNNDGDEIQLTGNFSGYYIYKIEKQWLDNSDEKVLLYKELELIDETNILDDSVNNDKTWQLCSNWEFKVSTLEKECLKEDLLEDTYEEDKEQEKKVEIIEEKNEEIENKVEDITIINNNSHLENSTGREGIFLNPKSIKIEEDKNEISKQFYAIIGLFIFCILLITLFGIKKYRESKNEFK